MHLDHTEFKTPGQYISALLDVRGWTKRVLAIVLQMDETAINKIASDKRPVTPEFSILLEEVFDVPASNFLALQQQYDLGKARLAARPDSGRSNRARLFGGLPVSDMIKRGWLDVDDIRNVAKTESELAKFFGAETAAEIDVIPHAAKKTDAESDATPAQMAWLYRVKSIAAELLVPRYSPSSAPGLLDKLKKLTHAPEEARKVPRLMAENGIRFVVVESLPGAKIDGVCLWLADDAPVVALSIRHDRIDNFWFVLRHELEHVFCGHGLNSPIIDADLEGVRGGTGSDVSMEERIANEAAADFCVPSRSLADFIAWKEPFFAERDILGFAKTLGIHPGLMVGQLQRRTGRYDRFRNHLVQIRSSVLPSATVDGWGDVYPLGIQ